MNNQTYQGAYSRRRFSNLSVNSAAADNTGLHIGSHGPVTLKKVTLKVSWNGAMGRVTGSGNYTVETATPPCQASAKVIPGTTVTLTAEPFAGYHFVRWNGLVTVKDTSNPVDVKMTQNCEVIAVFAPDTPGEHPSDNPSGGNGGEPPVSGGGNGGEPPVSGGGNGGIPGMLAFLGVYPRIGEPYLRAFVRKYWWAILIVAYIAYKEWKGARQ